MGQLNTWNGQIYGGRGKRELRGIVNKAIKRKKRYWKIGPKEFIIPIYKRGYKRDCSSCREVTLTSIPGKKNRKQAARKGGGYVRGYLMWFCW